MKNGKIILWVLSLMIIALPTVQAVRILDNQETIGSGNEGETVTYVVRIQNDESYPVDIQLLEESSNWEVTIFDSERKEVQPGETEEFNVNVEIPISPEENECISILRFYQKVSYLGFNEYSKDLPHEITTSVDEEEEPSTVKLVFLSSLSIFFIGTIGYLWYGRKYYFITPLYTNIPKDRLLDHNNRGLISQYLSENNGSSLSEISTGTGIHIQTLRHHIKLFEQSNLVIKKQKRYFIRKPGSDVVDTDILSPILQKLLDIIDDSDGISMSQLAKKTNRSKPWIGNRIHDLVVLNLIEVDTVGRFKYLYLKGHEPNTSGYSKSNVPQSLAG